MATTPSTAAVAKRVSRVRMERVAVALLLALMVFGFGRYKMAVIQNNPHFRADAPGSLYFSENAFHFYCAEILATDPRPFARLAREPHLEHPEPINVFRDETVLMEMPAAFSYRWLKPGVSFNVWALWWHALFSSLALVAVFLIVRELTGDAWAGVGAAAAYLTTPAAYGRMVGSPYLREDYALVWLLASAWALLVFLRRGKAGLGVALGATMAVALCAWHVSPFFYTLALPYLFWLLVTEPARLRWWWVPVAVLVAAGLAVQVLREKSFLFSPLLCGLAGIAVAAWFAAGRGRWARGGIAAGAGLAVYVLGGVAGARHGQSYSHVYELIWAKVTHLLQKPADPAGLSFEVRQLWEGDFNTPPLGQLWEMGRGTLLAGLVAAAVMAVQAWRRARGAEEEAAGAADEGVRLMSAYLAAVFAGMSLFISRVLIMGVPFLAAAPCVLLRRRWMALAACGVLVLVNAHDMNVRPRVVNKYPPEIYEKLFAWVRAETVPEAGMVANMAIGPMLVLNTGRPNVLHAKFENRRIRLRNEEYTRALYGEDEGALYDFCRKHRAEYLVFDGMQFLWDADDSDRYKMGMAEGIGERVLAARLFFCDAGLEHFEPVYQNLYFNVFRVTERRRSDAPRFAPPVAPGRFRRDGDKFVATTDTFLGLVAEAERLVQEGIGRLQQGDQAGGRESGLRMLAMAADLLPQYSLAVYLLAANHRDLGHFEAAERIADLYLGNKTADGLGADVCETALVELKADLLLRRGQNEEAARRLKECLRLTKPTAQVHRKLGQALGALGRWEEARASLKEFLDTPDLGAAERSGAERELAEAEKRLGGK